MVSSQASLKILELYTINLVVTSVLTILGILSTVIFLYLDTLCWCCCGCFLSATETLRVFDPDQPERDFIMEAGRVVEVTDEDDLETEGNNIDCVTDTVICISDNNQLHDETNSIDIIEKEACEDEPLIEHNKVDAEQIDDVINDEDTIFMDETDD